MLDIHSKLQNTSVWRLAPNYALLRTNPAFHVSQVTQRIRKIQFAWKLLLRPEALEHVKTNADVPAKMRCLDTDAQFQTSTILEKKILEFA